MVQSNGSTLVINKTDTEQLTRSEVEEAYDRVETILRNSSEISQDSEPEEQQIVIEYNANAQESTALEGTAQAEESTANSIVINKIEYEQGAFENVRRIISSEWIITGSLGALVCIGWYTKNPEVLYSSSSLITGKLFSSYIIYSGKSGVIILDVISIVITLVSLEQSYINGIEPSVYFIANVISRLCIPNVLDTPYAPPIIGAMTFPMIILIGRVVDNIMLLRVANEIGEEIRMRVVDQALYSIFDEIKKAPMLATIVALSGMIGGIWTLYQKPTIIAKLKKALDTNNYAEIKELIETLLNKNASDALDLLVAYLKVEKQDAQKIVAQSIIEIVTKFPQSCGLNAIYSCALEAMKLFFKAQQYDMLGEVITKFNGKDAKMAIELSAPYLKIEDARSKADDIIITLAKNFPKDCMLKTMELLYEQLNDSNEKVRNNAKLNLTTHFKGYPFVNRLLSLADTKIENKLLSNQTFIEKIYDKIENGVRDYAKNHTQLESFNLSSACTEAIHRHVGHCFTVGPNYNACEEIHLIETVALHYCGLSSRSVDPGIA